MSKHFLPFPNEPAGQVHLKPPSELTQVALESQGESTAHSSTSTQAPSTISKPAMQSQISSAPFLKQYAFSPQSVFLHFFFGVQ